MVTIMDTVPTRCPLVVEKKNVIHRGVKKITFEAGDGGPLKESELLIKQATEKFFELVHMEKDRWACEVRTSQRIR